MVIVRYRAYAAAVARVAMIAAEGLDVRLLKWGRGWLVVS